MTTEERARKWLRDTWPWSFDSDGPSDREVRLLSAEFDAVAVEQWNKDQSNHHGIGTVTCQPCISLQDEIRETREVLEEIADMTTDAAVGKMVREYLVICARSGPGLKGARCRCKCGAERVTPGANMAEAPRTGGRWKKKTGA